MEESINKNLFINRYGQLVFCGMDHMEIIDGVNIKSIDVFKHIPSEYRPSIHDHILYKFTIVKNSFK